MTKQVLIIGTGSMSRTYYRHLTYLGCRCLFSYRDYSSKNTQICRNEFGESSLIYQRLSIHQNYDYVLSCTSVDSHLNSLLPFINRKNCFLLSEKPISFDLNEIIDYPYKEIRLLMNRRYYNWVDSVKNQADNNKIKKVVVNLPERSSPLLNSKVPRSIIDNSIHIFDLISYICGELSIPFFSSSNNNSIIIFTGTSKVEQIIFNINFDAIERFNICFYLFDNTVIKAEPIENAFYFTEFNILEPTPTNFIRSYIPKSYEINPVVNTFDFQKTGIFELCKDVLSVSTISQTRLPDLNDSIKHIRWIYDNWPS